MTNKKRGKGKLPSKDFLNKTKAYRDLILSTGGGTSPAFRYTLEEDISKYIFEEGIYVIGELGEFEIDYTNTDKVEDDFGGYWFDTNGVYKAKRGSLFANIRTCWGDGIYIDNNLRLTDLLIFPDVTQLSSDSKEYTVKASDTSFFKSNIVVPYNDVGRPQFEEWLFKKRVTNETSNYINVSGRINVHILHEHRYPIDCINEYKVFCNENNLEEWGPILNIGKLSNYTYMTNNLDKFWNAISNHKDITILIKK